MKKNPWKWQAVAARGAASRLARHE